MSTPVFHRRRAERFAQLLDKAVNERHDQTSTTEDDDLTTLVSVARRITTAGPAVEVDPGFRADLRAMLVATAQREGIGVTMNPATPTPSAPARRLLRPALAGRRARTRTLVVLGVAVGAITVSGISAASDNSLPGDALYGMKRSTERAQLAWAKSDADRARLHLSFARTRLTEAQALRGDPAVLVAVLDDMDAEIRQGVSLTITYVLQSGKAAGLDTLTAFVADQRRSLESLARTTSGVEHDRVTRSLELLDSVTGRTEAVQAALACGAGPSGEVDELGQRPGRCPANR